MTERTPRNNQLVPVSKSRETYETAFVKEFRREQLGMVANMVAGILRDNGIKSVHADGTYEEADLKG
jgi:hypothetical protein